MKRLSMLIATLFILSACGLECPTNNGQCPSGPKTIKAPAESPRS